MTLRTMALFGSQQVLAESAEDVRKAIAGTGLRGRRQNLRLVDSAADAQLIVEIKGRRSGGGLLLARSHSVLVGVKAGPKLANER